jgi:PIN domain nuclease of toxin-antitoxin system
MGAATARLDGIASGDVAVSAISCWEVAALHAKGRLAFECSLDQRMRAALQDASVTAVNITPSIAVESTRLPGEFHRDPADRMLIATSRVLGCRLLTADQRILDYQHADALSLSAFSERGVG